MSIRGGAVREWGSREELGRDWAVPWSHGVERGVLVRRGGARARALSVTEAERGGLGGGVRRGGAGRGSWALKLGVGEGENLGARCRG